MRRHLLVLVGVGLREVVHRVEEEHGNVLTLLLQHVGQGHAFGLEARGDAGRRRLAEHLDDHGTRVGHVSSSSMAWRTSAMASSSVAAPRAIRAMRSAVVTGAASTTGAL